MQQPRCAFASLREIKMPDLTRTILRTNNALRCEVRSTKQLREKNNHRMKPTPAPAKYLPVYLPSSPAPQKS